MDKAKTSPRASAQGQRDALLLAILRKGAAEGSSPGDVVGALEELLASPGVLPTVDELRWVNVLRMSVQAILSAEEVSK